MKKEIICAALLSMTTGLQAQGFINLNFESADISGLIPNPSNPPAGYLPWAEAVPGWNHGGGPDSGLVYYASPHVGIAPWYLLVDPGGNQPLEGQFSIAMKNGNSDGQDFQSPWISSYLSQTALMPVGTGSLTLLATGNLAIHWNGTPLSITALGGNLYGADVSALAGTVGELRITNLGLTHGDLLTVDDIRFRNTVVPEPASITLLAIAITAAVLVKRSRRQA